MRYRSSSYKGLQQHRPSRLPSFGGAKKNVRVGLVVAAFVLLFGGSMFLFRTAKHEKPKDVSSVLATTSTVTPNPSEFSQTSATLIGLTSNKPVGTATRSLVTSLFHLSMSVTLPGIDRASQFYQAWLVRPVPYDYVSAGELITNDLGTFILDWNGLADKDYSGYTNLVITLQARGGDEDPQGHIAEGGFGK